MESQGNAFPGRISTACPLPGARVRPGNLHVTLRPYDETPLAGPRQAHEGAGPRGRRTQASRHDRALATPVLAIPMGG